MIYVSRSTASKLLGTPSVSVYLNLQYKMYDGGTTEKSQGENVHLFSCSRP